MTDPKNVGSDVGSPSAFSTQLSTPVLDIQKNARERVRISLMEFRGSPYIDVRVWFVAPGGEYKATSKGVTIRPNQVAQLLQGLMLASQMLEPAGRH